MPAPKPLDPGKSPLHFFGSELRYYRQRAELTQDELGGRVNYSADRISKVETGEQTPTAELAELCDTELATDGALTRLLAIVDTSAFPDWFRRWVEEIECKAHTLHTWQPLLVPGLLQTPEYAHAILRRRPGVTADKIDEEVAARMERKAIFDRDEPPLLWAFLDEGVLHRLVGSPKVMHDQLWALLEATQHTHISVQIVPTEAQVPGLLGAFIVAILHGQPDTVYLETAGKSTITDRAAEVRTICVDYDAIRAGALPTAATIEQMTKVMDTRWKTQT